MIVNNILFFLGNFFIHKKRPHPSSLIDMIARSPKNIRNRKGRRHDRGPNLARKNNRNPREKQGRNPRLPGTKGDSSCTSEMGRVIWEERN